MIQARLFYPWGASMNTEFRADSKRAGQLRRQAEAFASKPRLLQALGAACQDITRHAAALAKPDQFLRQAGLSLPEGLAFELFEHPPRHLPFPDWTPFMIELTSCKTVYVVECDDTPTIEGKRKCKLTEQELCLGFRIVARPWPRGPYTL
jgi:hypothetical protein